jgi:plasmid maintenance system antidote protein VapI
MNDNNRLVQQGIMLKKIRDEFSRSAEEVASYLGFGNRQSVYDLEAGRRDLKAYEALRLAEYYGVSTDSVRFSLRFRSGVLERKAGCSR